jgi:hypothetical protein
MERDFDGVRRDWEEGHRQLELASRSETQEELLRHQFEVVSAELRRRVGGTFTLAMLVAVYSSSDAWTRQAIEEHAATAGWARSVAMVGDAAFHVYARGAVDYTP